MAVDWATLWVLLYLLVLILILYWSLLFSSLHAAAFATVIYMAYYLVAYAGNGCREWHWLRSLALWDWLRPYQVCCASSEEFFQGEKYVLLNADYYLCSGAEGLSGCGGSLLECGNTRERNLQMTLWSFGLYGKAIHWIQRVRPVVCLPNRVFYVPYLTEALQWTGCVADRDVLFAWDCASVVIGTSREFEQIIALSAQPFKVALFRHDRAARCTVIGPPFVYNQQELERQSAVLARVSLVDPYDSLV